MKGRKGEFFRRLIDMRKIYSINIKLLFIIALTAEVLIGCMRTEGSLKLAGKVSDESTKTGIHWKNIIVQGVVHNNNNSETIEIGQFSTDSTGFFTYSLRMIKDVYNYNFYFIGNSDYPVTIEKLTLSDLKNNAKYLFFSMNRLVDLNIKICRKSLTPVSDTLHLIWESNGIFGLSIYPYTVYNYGRSNDTIGFSSGGDLWWVGGNVISTINTKVFAGKRTELNWELFRGGKRMEFTDTITCKRDAANTIYFIY